MTDETSAEEIITKRIAVRLRRKLVREAQVKCTCGFLEFTGWGELTDVFTMRAGVRLARIHNATAHQNTYRVFHVSEKEIK